jgi:uncharacterized protein
MADMIEKYPGFSKPSLEQRALLHPGFQTLDDGISEFTFAGIYLFREAHDYAISDVGDGLVAISGGREEPFFMLPFGLPATGTNGRSPLLDDLFTRFGSMKCAPASMAESLSRLGYRVWEDRDNFDYLYPRDSLAALAGRSLHSKKNLANLFLRNNACMAKPLLQEYTGDALRILDEWRRRQDSPGDYAAAREALERMVELQLCGGIFYVNDEPVAYTLGEELAHGTTFVIHFEKAVLTERYKGIYQYVNQAFAAVLPKKYETINREQDLGDPGLRKAKESYKPIGFVEKYRASK